MTDVPHVFLTLFSFANIALQFIIALTLLFFVYGVFKLVVTGKDSKEREQARGYIIWGLVALAVMVSVWGIVNLILGTFNLPMVTPRSPDFPNLH